MSHHSDLFGGVSIPDNVSLEIVRTPEEFLSRMNAAFATKSGSWFMGPLFKQGNRAQFSSAATIEEAMAVTVVHSAVPKDDVVAVRGRVNRPEQKPHGKGLREYLKETFCLREPGILPGLTGNCGVDPNLQDGAEIEPNAKTRKARLVVWVPNDSPDVTVYMAILIIPKGMKLTLPDGGHRWREINRVLTGNASISKPDEKDALRENSIPFVIVFEASLDQLHQDFADCGKAKPISKSLLNTYDRRDDINATTVAFVESNPFVLAYTDATTNTVNLSGGSKMAWSMSAWRNFVNFICGGANTPPAGAKPAKKMEGASTFINECVRAIPQLIELEAHRKDPASGSAPVDLRSAKGGSVLLRSVGLSILARAFAFAKSNGVPYDVMADALATIDWNLLTVERSTLPQGQPDAFAQAVMAAATPMWRSLIVVNDLRFRVASATENADRAWSAVLDQIEPRITVPLAAE